MQIILLSTDLMLTSVAQGVADRHGATLAAVGNVADACQRCTASPASLVAVDLRTPGLDVGDLVLQVRAAAPGVVIIASGPHVQRDSLAAAVAAGCDEVITRGEFDRRLEALVARLTA